MESSEEVLFVVRGSPPKKNASARYRVLEAIPFLKREGVDTEIISIGEESNFYFGRLFERASFATRLLLKASQNDIVLVQRLLLPGWYLKILEKVTEQIIFDFDDALYASPPWDPSVDKESELQTMLDHASAVTTGSPVLSKYAETYSAETYCLPTPLPREQYATARRRRTPDESTVVIGWIGYPHNLRFLKSVSDAFLEVLNTYPEAELQVITSDSGDLRPLQDHPNVTYQQWSPEDELRYLTESDIGVRPLQDTPWVRGKGGFTSVAQFMALGIPVVVTPVGMLSDMVAHGESGFHAETESDWTKYMSKLIQSQDLRSSMGQSASEAIDRNGLWTKNYADDLFDIIMSLHGAD